MVILNGESTDDNEPLDLVVPNFKTFCGQRFCDLKLITAVTHSNSVLVRMVVKEGRCDSFLCCSVRSSSNTKQW